MGRVSTNLRCLENDISAVNIIWDIVARGITFLCKLFQTIDLVATIVCAKCAGGIVRPRLTATEMVALQLTAGLNSTARIFINRF